MKLIVGLGNPGKEFEKTRHNAGFLAVDKIVDNFQFSIFNFQSIFNAQISNGIFKDKKVILLKPQTFMNESGKAVRAVLDYYKIKPENIIAIHDDLDIPLGEYKISKNRGSAGHKGVQSIIDSLGTKNFTRIRTGIGAKTSQTKVETRHCLVSTEENKKIPAERFVLEKFSKEEMEALEKIIARVAEEIVKLLNC